MKNLLGFTLIELLVVISIIGIIASLAIVSYTSSQKQTRDTQRKSDLKQYQTSLENYANGRGGFYPKEATVPVTTLCADLNAYFEPDMTCSNDPKDPDFIYNYQSNGSGAAGSATATIYVLWSTLESKQNTFWVVCSTGKTGEATTGIPPTAGVCPI